MDIHRCRFVPYEASAINCVSFSHPSIPFAGKHSKTVPARLAIGRANGDIEIWNPMQGRWLQEMTITGGQGRSIESLTWVVGDDEEIDGGKHVIHGQMRLFSIGYTNTITEWDLENACAKRHASGQHGEIWCLGTQPKLPAGAKAGAAADATQRLVGGTIDGSVVLYTTEDDDLRFQRLFRTHKKRVKMVSIDFQSRHVAVVGCSDSSIRVFDLRKGAVTHTMALGRDFVGGSKEIIAWTVRCLPNGTIVSGDSTGQVCIWDGLSYNQIQRIQGHKEDVLSLTMSPDGSSLVSGGMDRRIVMYQELAGRPGRFGKFWSRKYHKHDVRTMASFEARGISVVIAGGPDAAPMALPLEKTGMQNHRALSHLPQAVPVASAPNARLMMAWWQTRLRLWTFDQPIDELLGHGRNFYADVEHNKRLVGQINISGDAHITSAAISADGSFVIAATAAEVKAFQLRTTEDDQLIISKLRVPPQVATKGATKVSISPDGRWVALARGISNELSMLEVVPPETEDAKMSFSPLSTRLRRLKRNIPRYQLFSGLGRYDRRTTQMAFSPDSRMLATADLAGYIDTWVLRSASEAAEQEAAAKEDDEDSSDSEDSEDEDQETDKNATARASERWIRNPLAKQMPKLDTPPVVLSFSPDVPGKAAVTDALDEPVAHDYVLLAVTATSRLMAFNPLRARLAPWFRRLNPSNLPVEYRDILDLAKGVLWQGPRAWIYGASFLFMVDTSVEVSADGEGKEGKQNGQNGQSGQSGQEPPAKRRRKRNRANDTGAGGDMEIGRLEPKRVQLAVAGEEKDNKESKKKEWTDVEMQDVLKSKRARHERAEDDHFVDSDEDDDDEEDDDDDIDEEAREREASQQQLQSEQMQLVANGTASGSKQHRTRWWNTFKYRPILGVVPLASPTAVASAAATNGESSSSSFPPLEVALVERPGWDLAMPMRYGEEDQ